MNFEKYIKLDNILSSTDDSYHILGMAMPGTRANGHFTDISHLTFKRSYEVSFISSVLQMQHED